MAHATRTTDRFEAGEGRAGRGVILAWCFYDFANSSFTTLIVTLAFSVYFRQVVVGEGARGDLLWGRAISISMLIVALTAPLLGAAADRTGARKRFMMAMAGICIVCTGLLSLVQPGQVLAAMLLFIAANIGFAGGNVFYNAFLPEIAGPGRIGKISGYGWALGYLGGLACLGLVFPLISGGLEPENLGRFRASFVVVALFFFLFSLPAFIFLKDSRPGATAAPKERLSLLAGYRRLLETFRRVRRYRELVKFLLAFFLYNDAIHTVVAFTSIYAIVSLGFTIREITILFIWAQLTAFLGAWIFGPLVDRIGGTRTIRITLVIWCLVVIGAFLVQTKGAFWVILLVAGFAMGANQAASRGLMGRFIPAGRNAEFFGFFALGGKFSAVLGPVLFGWISVQTGSQRIAILSLLGFFLAGLALMGRLDETAGIGAARNGSAEN